MILLVFFHAPMSQHYLEEYASVDPIAQYHNILKTAINYNCWY